MLHPSRVAQIVGSWEWRSEEVATERGIGGKIFLKKGPVDDTIAKTRTSWPHDCKNNFCTQVGEKSFTFKWKITPKGVKVNYYTSKWKKKVKLKRHISPTGEHFYTRGCKYLHFVVHFYTWAVVKNTRGGFAQRGQCPLFLPFFFPWGLPLIPLL